jgi:hypothetical protein
MRKPVIGVIGGSGSATDAVMHTAKRLGSLIARRGWVLINGGRNVGVMAASARGAREAGGTVIGVLPGKTEEGISPDLDIAIFSGMGDARNLINVLSCDVVIACPGRAGTMSEVALALKNDKPVVLLGLETGPAFTAYRKPGLLSTSDSPEAAIERAEQLLREQKRL